VVVEVIEGIKIVYHSVNHLMNIEIIRGKPKLAQEDISKAGYEVSRANL
jgi:hypothetical protein